MSIAAVALLVYCAAQAIASAQPQDQTSKSPELAEAAKLSVSVAQLFGEGKYNEALPLAKRALQIREKLLNPDDERLTVSRRNLAEIYFSLTKYDDARELFERVRKSLEQSAAEQPALAEILERLAIVELTLGYPLKTEELFKRALEINDKALGMDHPKAQRSAFLLAEFYQSEGELKKAEPIYKRVVATREKSSSPTVNEDLREAADRYGCLLRKLKREDEARELRTRVYGPETPGSKSLTAPRGVLNGSAIRLPRPSYPQEARIARVSGIVVVQVTIDESGNIIRVCAIAGPALLAVVSERAAGGAKFTPTLLNGKPVKVTGVITYNFVGK